MLAEHIENLLCVAAFLRACIKLSVGVGSGTSLTETIVALTVHLMRSGDEREVCLALAHILSALYHHRAQS